MDELHPTDYVNTTFHPYRTKWQLGSSFIFGLPDDSYLHAAGHTQYAKSARLLAFKTWPHILFLDNNN